ncbi:hypothetical protein WOLCODRAFT_146847 [Wolfiporia cocos MD-104 SS10]|uniref:Uncharacterized protein n=1 Tax=Wolfiporia cocos (strain MD-104) TaxID=742152 RepID=A0A2H3J9X0_WOLCO|nr:hypothetical protein WOLCODRAFT_146847 [Wolfiporia cocos MD-104 SS10]
MAPSLRSYLSGLTSRSNGSIEHQIDQPFNQVKAQWRNPNDILSIVQLIGGDTVQTALAASTSPSYLTPVAFSFGWVAYAFSTISTVFGDGTLMPSPDCNAILVNARSGYQRDIKSWVLGRIVRDHEPPREKKPSLTITFYRAVRDKPVGIPDRDMIYFFGVAVIIVQFVIACIPGVLDRNWVPLIITFAGTILVQATGAIRQWSREKWNGGQVEGEQTVCITQGNGSRSVQVITTQSGGHNLEHMAAGPLPDVKSRATTVATIVLAVLWVVHLITVESLSSDAWYSVAIGALGMLQNTIAAGAKWSPSAFGFHWEMVEIVSKPKVFKTLQEAEKIKPGVGLALLPVFFPGELRNDEMRWKEEKLRQYKANDAAQIRPQTAMTRDTDSPTALSVDITAQHTPGQPYPEIWHPISWLYPPAPRLRGVEEGATASAVELGRYSPISFNAALLLPSLSVEEPNEVRQVSVGAVFKLQAVP